jgi:hypothetical protein
MRFVLLLLSLFVIVGCTETHENIKKEPKTIEQSILESDVLLKDVLYTEEIGELEAFSLYETPGGYGILHFQKEDNSWEYRGSSDFGNRLDDKVVTPISFASSTWIKGESASGGKNAYITVFFGEVVEPDISKVSVEYNDKDADAKILTRKERKFWYLISKEEDGKERVEKISGYSSNGRLVYEDVVYQK